MASAIGEDRGWGMSEAVPQPAKRSPSIHMYIKAWLCQQLGFRSGWIIRQRLTSTSERKE